MDETQAGRRNADEARLEALFQRHYRDVVGYVRRRAGADVVDDVVADTFLVAWRRLDEVPVDARPWLLAVARKTLATHRRSAARQRSLLVKLEPSSEVEEADRPWEGHVSKALARLSETDREAITLIAWEGLTPREAALVVGQSPVAFRVRLHRAKRRLRQRLEDLEPSNEHELGPVATQIAVTKGGLKR
jgi:RNA polymerase sigma-70 factor (ECF subfamily)